MKKHKKIILVLLLVLFMIPLAGMAQLYSPHEFSIWGNVGSSALNSSMNKGKSKSALGYGGGIGYTLNFTSLVGINTGVEVASYNNKFNAINVSDLYFTSATSEVFGHTMERHKEKATAVYLQIPLMLQFQTSSEMHRFYVMAGGKIGIPIKSESKLEPTRFTTTGFKPNSQTPIGQSDSKGVVISDRPSTTTDISIKTAFIASLELGVKWRVAERTSLLTGVYLDYGVNNILKEVNKRLVTYNSEHSANFIYNSMVDSRYYDTKSGVDNYFVKNMKPFVVGAKLRLSFAVGGDTGYRRQQRKSEVRKQYMDTYQRDYKLYRDSDIRENTTTIRKRVEETENKTMNVNMKDVVRDYLDNTKNKTKGYQQK